MRQTLIFAALLLFSHQTTAGEKEALKKISHFGKSLKSELIKGLETSPQAALNACKMKAPELASQASNDEVLLGRVSLKQRNPKNAPKAWMKESIKAFHAGEIDKDYVVVEISEVRRGILKPIKTGPICLQCHGQSIDEELLSEIDKLYPNDEARGYKNGEIRGFFFAEFDQGLEN